MEVNIMGKMEIRREIQEQLDKKMAYFNEELDKLYQRILKLQDEIRMK